MFDWNPKANDLFLVAKELSDPRELERFLDDECGADQHLRAEVEELLSANESAGEFLNQPVVPNLMAPTEVKGQAESGRIGAGSTIGRYKLLEEIGEGGFGVVYMAEQRQPVRRNVAFKIIKPGMDTRDVIARFEAERQAVAMMNHPNIAKVLDAGTTNDGGPYFVMELVKGLPVVEFCNEAKLSIEERLELFTIICRAIQHAHQKGVIHRDIKPSNILVTLHGDEPVPMIIDFGVAKALNQPLTTKTLFTRYGQMVGTPQYMSPEQSGISGIDVDTRSDIYSLGVLLYELLTDSTPLEPERIKDAAVAEIARLVQEEEAPTPSIRLSRLGERLPIVCQRRKTDEKRLTQFVRGDLDWVVMKAIEKNRNRRYESAGNLAEDVGRFMGNEPVEARSPTARYRAMKFLRRNRLPVTLVAVFAIGLVAGLVGTTIAWLDAAKARAQEAVQREMAQDNEAELRRHLYASLMARAEIAIRDGKMNNARDLLAKCPPDLRGWEWQHLNLRSPRRNVVSIPDAGFFSYSPDGQRILAGRSSSLGERSISMWDARTGERISTIVDVENPVRCVQVSPEGRRIAFSEGVRKVTVCELSGKAMWTTYQHEEVRRIAFSPDGSKLATAGGGFLRVFNADDGELLMTKAKSDAQRVAFSPDGERVACSGSVWECATEKLKFELKDDDYFNTTVFSPDGQLIASGGIDGQIKLWDAESGSPVRTLYGHRSWIRDLKFSPDGDTLASAGADTAVRLWDVKSGQLLRVIGDHDDVVYWLSFSPDGRELASYSIGNGVLIWSVSKPDVMVLQSSPSRIPPRFTADGKRIISGSGDGLVRCWDSRTGQLQRTVFGDESGIGAMVVHPNEKWFATSNRHAEIQLRDLNDGRLIRRFPGHDPWVYDLVFSPDGKHLISAGVDGKMNVWDVGTGKVIWSRPCEGDSMGQVAVSPDNHWIAAISEEREVQLWDANTGEPGAALPHHTQIDSLQFAYRYDDAGARIGLQLACGCRDATVMIWDPNAGAEIGRLHGRTSWILGMAYGPNARRLWTQSLDGFIAVWNPKTEEELVTLGVHNRWFGMSISPDGKTVATALEDGTVRLLESEPVGPELASARAAVVEAQGVVHKAYRELIFSSDVIKAIETSEDIAPRIRQLAIDIAKARGDDAYALSRHSRTVVNDTDVDESTLRLALSKATRAAEVLPQSRMCSTTLAMVLYRLGEYERALSTLDSTEDIEGVRPALPVYEEILRQTYRDMTLFRLNRLASTEQTLSTLENALQQVPEPGHADLQAARRELVRLTSR